MIAAVLLAGFCAPAQLRVESLVGGYSADWSRAKGSKGVLQVFFGQGRLRLSPGGKFTLLGETVAGFWRVEKGKVVLVFSGLFGHPFALADAELKRRWPTHQLQGLVFRPRSDGTLILDEFGAVQGPVFFRKLPLRTFAELLAASEKVESSESYLPMDAFFELSDRVKKEWRTLLQYIRTPQNPAALRGWATFFLAGAPAEAVDEAAGLLDHLQPADKKNKDRRYFQNILALNLSQFATKASAVALLRNETRLNLRPSELADAIGHAHYTPGIPRLIEFLKSDSEYVKENALRALAGMQVSSALDQIRILVKDKTPDVRVAALWAILTLSEDQAERSAAIDALAKEFGKPKFADLYIYKALGDSHDARAVPILAEKLMSDIAPRDRAAAAEALGNLGVPEAIPVLREAWAKTPKLQGKATAPNLNGSQKQMKAYFGQMFSLMDVQKQIVEALWKYDHPTPASPSPRDHARP